MNSNWLTLTRDSVWPWSAPFVGLPLLILVAGALVALTVWTYRGVQGASQQRVMTVLGLRLAALLMACLMALRPSLAFRDELREPSILIIATDRSQSMSIQDEAGPQSRWESMIRILEKCGPTLQRLRDTHNISTVVYQFAEDAVQGGSENPVPQGQPDGTRTDFGKMLNTVYENHAADHNLRGLIIISDGADNGTNFQPLTEAAKLRKIPCPINTFGLGKTTTGDQQRDIAFTAIKAEPSPVPVKGKLTVMGTLDAPGFENKQVNVRLFIDDKEVLAKPEILKKTSGNEVKLTTDAPDRPGEIKVTLKIDPVEGELVAENNEISTYVTVIKEGLSVLLVDKMRAPEPQRICDALRDYRSINLYAAWQRTDALEQEGMFELDKRRYDVIILGDLSAKRLTGGNPQVLEEIAKQVKDKGAGLLMMGGYQSFGNSDWQGTPIEDLLPVKLDVSGQVDDKVLWALEPTSKGLGHYVMRLAATPEANRDLWNRLPKLTGYTRLGQVKAGATVLAVVRGGTEDPMLVGMEYGKGRTLAFAGDTTWRWELLGQPKSTEGIDAHAHFWKQIVYWLAHQDKSEGNIQVSLDSRRMPTGGKVGFTVGMYGKDGELIPNSRSLRFQVAVKDPQGNDIPVPTALEEGSVRGHFWKTDLPGEYQLVAQGWYKDADGKETSGGDPAKTRFLVYQDNTELLVRAANHDFLTKLASAGGGKFHKAEDLPLFLKDLEKLPLPQAKSKAELWPDWRRHTLSGFLVWFFLMFVALLSLEWFLRRRWGMV